MSGFVILFIWVVSFIGWVMNILQVLAIAKAALPVTTMFLLKCAGIFVGPLGVVLGYIG